MALARTREVESSEPSPHGATLCHRPADPQAPCHPPPMTEQQHKQDLHRHLQAGRDALLWKLDGVSEYDVRRPLTPSGTNLLGLVKHLAYVEAGYFGTCFGRPFPDATWDEQAHPESDMWATPDQTRNDVLGLYRRATAHADSTIAELPLDAPAIVPWWAQDVQRTMLHLLLVHVVAELNRHLGHADVLRESLDGAVGFRRDNLNTEHDVDVRGAHRTRVEQAARDATS